MYLLATYVHTHTLYYPQYEHVLEYSDRELVRWDIRGARLLNIDDALTREAKTQPRGKRTPGMSWTFDVLTTNPFSVSTTMSIPNA